MKQITTGLLAIASMFIVACSNDADNENLTDKYLTEQNWVNIEQAENPGLAYFDALKASSKWYSNNLNERLAALNLPKKLLNKLTTVQLAECCAKYPFNLNYLACNSTHEDDLGLFIKANIMDHFNGFNELKARPDYATGLIDVYQALSQDINDALTSGKTSQEITGDIDRSFLELVLYYEQYPEVFVGEQGQRLRSIVLNNIAAEKGTEYETGMYGTLGEKLIAKVDKYASK